MIKGMRYKLTVVIAGRYEKSVIMNVGVLLSNGTEIGTLDGRHLRRSIGWFLCYVIFVENTVNYYLSARERTAEGMGAQNPFKSPDAGHHSEELVSL